MRLLALCPPGGRWDFYYFEKNHLSLKLPEPKHGSLELLKLCLGGVQAGRKAPGGGLGLEPLQLGVDGVELVLQPGEAGLRLLQLVLPGRGLLHQLGPLALHSSHLADLGRQNMKLNLLLVQLKDYLSSA